MSDVLRAGYWASCASSPLGRLVAVYVSGRESDPKDWRYVTLLEAGSQISVLQLDQPRWLRIALTETRARWVGQAGNSGDRLLFGGPDIESTLLLRPDSGAALLGYGQQGQILAHDGVHWVVWAMQSGVSFVRAVVDDAGTVLEVTDFSCAATSQGWLQGGATVDSLVWADPFGGRDVYRHALLNPYVLADAGIGQGVTDDQVTLVRADGVRATLIGALGIEPELALVGRAFVATWRALRGQCGVLFGDLDALPPYIEPALVTQQRPLWRGATMVHQEPGTCRWGADDSTDPRPRIIGASEYRSGLDVLAVFCGATSAEVQAARAIADHVQAPVIVYVDAGSYPASALALVRRDLDLCGVQAYPGNGEVLGAFAQRLLTTLATIPSGYRIGLIRAEYSKNLAWSREMVEGIQYVVTQIAADNPQVVMDLAFGRGRGDYDGDPVPPGTPGDAELGAWLERYWSALCAATPQAPRSTLQAPHAQPTPTPVPVPPKPAPSPAPVPPVHPIEDDTMPLTPFRIRHRPGLYWQTDVAAPGRPTRLAAPTTADGDNKFQVYYPQLVRTPQSPAGALKFDVGATVELDLLNFPNNPLYVADAAHAGQATSSPIRLATRFSVRRSANGANWRFDAEAGLSLRPAAGELGAGIVLGVTDPSAADVVLEGLDGKELTAPF